MDKQTLHTIYQHTPVDSAAFRVIIQFVADPLYQISDPSIGTLPDTIAQIDIAIPKLRRNLHGSIRRGLRLASSDRMKSITEAASTGKIKKAIRYTLGSEIPYFDFTSIRDTADQVLLNPNDIHNATTKHYQDHFAAPNDTLNFTVNYATEETIAQSQIEFMNAHPNIATSIKHIIWRALTAHNTKLNTPSITGTTIKQQLHHISNATPSFKQFCSTL
jgi:hypothetical protein